MANGPNNTPVAGTRRSLIIVAVVVVAALAIGGFMSLRPRRIRVQVTRPSRQEILTTITTNGKVEPIQNFEAHSPGSTTVKRILVHEGERVKKGELLLELDDAPATAGLAKATAQLRAAQANYAALRAGGSQEELLNRQAGIAKARGEQLAANRNLQALTRLAQQGAASQEEVTAARERLNRAGADLRLLQQKRTGRFSTQDRERAQAEVADAEAAVKAAQDLIAESHVRAPFAGTVYALPVRLGAFVNTGDLLVQVAELTRMQVRAFVDEPEVGRLQMGQAVRITWDALPGRVWNGKITSLPTNIVNRGSRMIGEALCAVDNDDGKLLPNVNVTTLIVTGDAANALTLPREALHGEGNQRLVYVVKNDHLVEQPVQTGAVNLTRIEITKGLSESDLVALASLSPAPLSDGAQVKVVETP